MQQNIDGTASYDITSLRTDTLEAYFTKEV